MIEESQENQGTQEIDPPSDLKPVTSPFSQILGVLVPVTVAAGILGAIFSYAVDRPRTMGSTRSAMLKYEQRKAEVNRVVQEEEKGISR